MAIGKAKDFKLVSNLCADCNYPIDGVGKRVGILPERKRVICGFCFSNPGWSYLDPTYRQRRLTGEIPDGTMVRRTVYHTTQPGMRMDGR